MKEFDLHEPELRVDQILELGGYGTHRVVRPLGVGGMAAAFETIRLKEGAGKKKAVKLPRRQFWDRPDIFSRLGIEEKSTIGIEHDNILSVDGLYWTTNTQPKLPLLFMELLTGNTLREVMNKQKGLPLRFICAIAHGVLSGLQKIHPLGLVHRDIKPENIYLHERGGDAVRVVLMDFGIVKDFGSRAVSLNEEGLFLGSEGYAPPEQLRAEPVTERTDLYAFSVVLYEMFTLRPLFPELTNSRAIKLAHLNRRPTPLHLLVPNVPRFLTDMVMRGLEKDPANRPDNARIFAEPFTHAFLNSAPNAGNSTMERLLDHSIESSDGNAYRPRPVPGMSAPGYLLKGETLRMHIAQPDAPPPQAATATAPCLPPDGAEGSRPGTNPRAGSLPPTTPPPSGREGVLPAGVQGVVGASASSVSAVPAMPELGPRAGAAEPQPPLSSVAWNQVHAASSPTVAPPPGAPLAGPAQEDDASVVDRVVAQLESENEYRARRGISVDRGASHGLLDVSEPLERKTTTTAPNSRPARASESLILNPTDSAPRIPLSGPRPLYIAAAAVMGLLIAWGGVSYLGPRFSASAPRPTASVPIPTMVGSGSGSSVIPAPAAMASVAPVPTIASPPADSSISVPPPSPSATVGEANEPVPSARPKVAPRHAPATANSSSPSPRKPKSAPGASGDGDLTDYEVIRTAPEAPSANKTKDSRPPSTPSPMPSAGF